MREHLRAWLQEVQWPGLEAAGIVLAVNEAVSAAVSHPVPAPAA